MPLDRPPFAVGEELSFNRPSRAARRRIVPWMLIVGAAIAAAFVQGHGGFNAVTPVQRLLSTPLAERLFEPRVAGALGWAPFRNAHRAKAVTELGTAGPELTDAARGVLQSSGNDASLESRHSAAIAYLAMGNPRSANGVLADASLNVADASTWSDVAAIRYSAAVAEKTPDRLIDALVAADTALRLAPDLPEARFNRALIIERLGLREIGIQAWKRYLDVDLNGPWAMEARGHLQTLSIPPLRFRDELASRYDQIASNQAVSADLGRRFPLEVRIWSETEILGRWAEAEQRRDLAAAARHLDVARVFSRIVAARGDMLLANAVEAIDHGNGEQRLALASAHIGFRQAQREFMDLKPSAAEPLFISAAKDFNRGASPVELLARYFRANTAYEQGRVDEAMAALTDLLATAPPEYPSYRAQIEWQLGLCQNAKAHWGDAIATLKASVEHFAALNEAPYATNLREILSEVYDMSGDAVSAWDLRAAALASLGQTTSVRLQATLGSIAQTAILRRDWPASAAVLGLELDAGRITHSHVFYADALLRRALVWQRLGHSAEAEADLTSARGHVDRIEDAKYRVQWTGRLLWVEGVLAPSPSERVTLLSRAIGFTETSGRKSLIPTLFLDRAKAYRAEGDRAAAAADVESAIRALESHRESLPRGEQRWGVFWASEDLFDEAIELAVERGDVDGAFRYSERARARSLLDIFQTPPTIDLATIPASTTVIEYAATPSHVVIFVANRNGVRVISQPTDRTSLKAAVENSRRTFAEGAVSEMRAATRPIYDALIAPIASGLPPDETLVFVPDAIVSGVSFAALVGPDGRYLVEGHPVIVTPSAAVFTHGLKTYHPLARDKVLVVANGEAP
jgi:tetratricopeptide (TPR) repeat protein